MWGIDLTGPILASDEGYQYIFVAVNHYTRYPYAVPLKSKTQEEVRDAIEDLFLQFGAPEVIISDNGGEFVNATLDKLFRENNVEHRRTTARHPETNGLVERMHLNIKPALGKLCADYPGTWPSRLPQVLFGQRLKRATATKDRPIRMEIGQDPFANSNTVHQSKDLMKFIENHKLRTEAALELRQIGQENILESQIKAKARYDKAIQKDKLLYGVGDEVIIYDTNFDKRRGIPLGQSTFIGPYKALEIKDAHVVVMIGNKQKTFLKSVIKPYYKPVKRNDGNL